MAVATFVRYSSLSASRRALCFTSGELPVLAESMAKLQEEQAKLQAVQDELAAVIAKVDQLQAQCDATVAEKQRVRGGGVV